MADHTPPPGDKLHEDLRALPKVDNVQNINERAALAARLHIKAHHKALHDSLHDHIDTILDSVKPQLDTITFTGDRAAHFVIGDEELRAIVARSINTGAMQTAQAIGLNLKHTKTIENDS